ncbi:MAG: hypothetical protein Q4E39_06130 [bacterium]|nr:hypothetical protein [bacterium]
MLEEQIYTYLLNYHLGKENLIKNKDLRAKFHVNSDKSLRKIIQNIRENKQFSQIIGSVSGKSGGFYICESEEEIQETIDNIKHRANQMLRMCYILDWKRERLE